MRHPESLLSLFFICLAAGVPLAHADSSTVDSTVIHHDSSGAALESEDADSASKIEIDRTHVRQGSDSQAAGIAGDDVAVDRTTITEKQANPSAFRNEAFGFKPQVGLVTRSVDGDSSARGVAGLLMDVNFLRRAETHEGKPYFGLSFGALYSHLGTAGSDFLGLNGVEGDRGTHFLMIPLNLKAGYTFSDVFRLAAHGGANVQYSNTPNSFFTVADTSVSGGSQSNWATNPNLGADFEFGIGRNVGILLRPDWTFASGDTFFTGTLGIDIPLS